ncbi:chloramphenicol phosphotransferase CPT family protein [Marinivivus vitaminiproducens]|uniref:chloramphenicol phosphotransferase CPT family protein n=1 Tax=Marinivivus vitaminiproducens TaxID=3035935 RepID=UPI0027AB7F3B|nr:hypothetical protein P4R82_02250 [Geminicoccaceae bacterium SCSIO 64248]
MRQPGWIVVLNGAPRSGKSSIVAALQAMPGDPWMNLGVDVHVRHVTPQAYRPGIGLRPGGERPDLEPWIARFYPALYDSIAAHSRQGLNVVADLGHHEAYTTLRDVLPACARCLAGLPALLVGVRCPIDVIMARRNAGQAGREGHYVTGAGDGTIPPPVRRWQDGVHAHGPYDLDVDTSLLGPAACAEAILERLNDGIPRPSAFDRLAAPSDQ